MHSHIIVLFLQILGLVRVRVKVSYIIIITLWLFNLQNLGFVRIRLNVIDLYYYFGKSNSAYSVNYHRPEPLPRNTNNS